MIVTAMQQTTAAALLALALALPPVAAGAGESVRLLPPDREEWLNIADTVRDGNRDAVDGAADPLGAAMVLCEERGCTRTGRHSLSSEESLRLRALFAKAGDAAAERAAIGRAIALFETVMGARNGTWRDHPANQHEYETEPGQLDCIAESINTLSYLDRLNRAQLLRHHQVGGFIHRYTVVLQHVAVDIIPDDADEHFAVDSWVGANGEEPEITPYGDWRWEWGV